MARETYGNQPSKIHLRIGKNGITDGVIDEINMQIQGADPFVIKFLPAFMDAQDRKAAAEEIANRTRTKIAQLRGGVLILTRKH